ncbi:MAG: glycosyltransferase [Candidatus Falkowbacteria bacterium]
MRIEILSTLDIIGGASKPAYNLHKGLLRSGDDSIMVVQRKFSNDSTVTGPRQDFISFIKNKFIYPGFDELVRLLFFRNEENLHSAALFSSINLEKDILSKRPDIINAHWVWGGFVKMKDLSRAGVPIVWTLHDMWLFSGAEHYPKDEQYVNGYRKLFDFNRIIWQKKKRDLAQIKNLSFVVPSRWLYERAKNSIMLKKYDIKIIPYGLDDNIFKPINRIDCRNILSIDGSKKVILFGATNGIKDPRKGFDYLKKAVDSLVATDPKLNDEWMVVFFGCQEPEGFKFSIPYKFLGAINDHNFLPTVYSSADVFVAPSLQDNLPNTILEALGCGVPVVSFNVGGIPDMIDHKQNGYLAKYLDNDDLANGLKFVLNNEHIDDLRSSALLKFKNNFTIDLMVRRYQDLFRKIREIDEN